MDKTTGHRRGREVGGGGHAQAGGLGDGAGQGLFGDEPQAREHGKRELQSNR